MQSESKLKISNLSAKVNLYGKLRGHCSLGKSEGGRMRKTEWAPVMTDGDMTFDLVITDWEVVFTGVKHSWDMVAKYPNYCETFFFLLPA